MATQAERRASTRRALLDAAADVLVDGGLAAFTTTAVTARAGLSNGALFGHFPTRLDLLAATVEDILNRLRHDYDRTFAELRRHADAAATIELLWTSMSDPQLAAVLEAFTQARTDADLVAAIRPVVTAHSEYVHALVLDVALALADDDRPRAERLATIGNAAISAMQGLVVSQMAGTSLGNERDLITLFTVLAETTLADRDGTTRHDTPHDHDTHDHDRSAAAPAGGR